MIDPWVFGLRGIGIALAMLMGALIWLKRRKWDDPALTWLFFGLSVGPMIILGWNLFYRLWLCSYLTPSSRVTFLFVPDVQFRYVYAIINKTLDLGCVLAIAVGIARLYQKAQLRARLLPPSKATTNDPRN